MVPLAALLIFLLEANVSRGSRPVHVVLGLLIAAGVGYGLWHLDRRLGEDPGRVLVDPATGEQVRLVNKHDFFWLPLGFWGVVLGVLGAALAVLPGK